MLSRFGGLILFREYLKSLILVIWRKKVKFVENFVKAISIMIWGEGDSNRSYPFYGKKIFKNRMLKDVFTFVFALKWF